MLIKKKEGNIATTDTSNKNIDWLLLEWFETQKRILHKKTASGKEIVMKFMEENPQLTYGDIIYTDDTTLTVIDIIPCDAIVFYPRTMRELAEACYEIGNKHLPLFYENDTLLVPFDTPLFMQLEKNGYNAERTFRKLIAPLKTSVTGHSHSGNTKESLFNKIMKLTNNPE